MRSGFIFPTADTSAKTPVIKTAGHVFGRLGQGDDTTFGYGSVSAFRWIELKTATDKAGMLVSLYPVTDDYTGPTTSQEIEINVKGVAFAALSDFDPPSLPQAASAPNTYSLGSMKLTISAITSLLIMIYF